MTEFKPEQGDRLDVIVATVLVALVTIPPIIGVIWELV